MSFVQRRVTILRIRHPRQQGLNEELQWLCSSLGLLGERDKERTCFRLFLEMLKIARKTEGVTSDSLAESLALSRPAVLHHLAALQERGIVIHEGKRYFLCNDSLQGIMHKLQKDAEETLKDLATVAAELDRILER